MRFRRLGCHVDKTVRAEPLRATQLPIGAAVWTPVSAHLSRAIWLGDQGTIHVRCRGPEENTLDLLVSTRRITKGPVLFERAWSSESHFGSCLRRPLLQRSSPGFFFLPRWLPIGSKTSSRFGSRSKGPRHRLCVKSASRQRKLQRMQSGRSRGCKRRLQLS